MSGALRKMEGTEKVDVSLNRGTATLTLKAGNQTSLESIKRAVIDNGFTPREARVTANGKILTAKGKLAFQVTGPDTVYHVKLAPKSKTTDEDLKRLTGKQVSVEGIISNTEKRQPAILTINTVQVIASNERK